MAHHAVAGYGNNQLNSTSTNNDAMYKYLFMALLIILALPHEALADTASGASGDNIWSSVKGMLFSGWGMVYAVIIVFAGGFIWARRGIGEGIIVMASGFGTFFIPALVQSTMLAARSFAG